MSPDVTAAPAPATVTATGPVLVAGTDLPGALTAIRGELGDPHLPSLPLLPDRGPGADAVGRVTALLVDLPVEVGPHGWRVAARPGEDLRRSRSLLASDLNMLADLAGAEQTPATRIGVCVLGPVSLATRLDLAGGERVLADRGARRDLADSLAAGLATHLAAVRAALPGASVTVRIDEPALAAVTAGTVATASGYRTLRAVDRSDVRQTLRQLVEAVRDAGAHEVVLAVEPEPLPLALGREVEADGLALPATALTSAPDDLGEYLDGGGALTIGLDVDGPRGVREVSDLAGQVLAPWRRLGLPETRLTQLTLTARTSPAAITSTRAPAGTPDAGRLPAVLHRLVGTADALETTARDA
ncbi:hypothetical protein GCM10011512_13240 [Tersicoccus solisilvae]|uniref:Methionine synthase n=1 Tax=Tersicoccus solisilvae TaxID=1882339 RepID=A0ABQ1NYL0_9MICC|nr:hypothetical protein [Tersicoccus solisilvae]GGC87639.1 hypothetical protein GCM10011512_13240 [Tersicoccus solisilvae]